MALAIHFLSGINGYTGGTAGKLDTVATATRNVPQIFCFRPTGEGLAFYRLKSDDGSAVEDSPSIILPDDRSAENYKHFERIL